MWERVFSMRVRPFAVIRLPPWLRDWARFASAVETSSIPSLLSSGKTAMP